MNLTASGLRRRFLVPEVVQTSSMDCGPAAVKCLVEGLGVPISYGRLREACQTDVDGTSIDTMEELLVQLGFEAEQIMLPADHLLIPEARALPAIVVFCHPNGLTHFVVAWRHHGRFVQVMDPATGRRWPTDRRFLRELYVHEVPIPADAWREWASSSEATGVLRRRLGRVGLSERAAESRIDAALSDSGWRPIGTLDAATRFVHSIVQSGALKPGRSAARGGHRRRRAVRCGRPGGGGHIFRVGRGFPARPPRAVRLYTNCTVRRSTPTIEQLRNSSS